MAPFRSAKGFLQYGGIVLVVVALLGFFRVIGPTPEDSLFGGTWNFTAIENWLHLIIGVVALLAASMLKQESQVRGLVNVVAVVALVFGVLGFFTSFGDVLQNPLDNILHLVIAIWAFWAVKGKNMPGMA